jgi:pimeloyl-ACP methyl ester carboxylesterase
VAVLGANPLSERSGLISTITTNDGTEIYNKDWGEGPAVTFSHGWPLDSDMWDGLLKGV